MKNSVPKKATPEPADLRSRALADLGFGSEDAWLLRARQAEATEALGEIDGYKVLDVCGRGGQGTVYRARRADGQTVAIKRIHGGAGAKTKTRQQLLRELEAAGQLSHPNIVKVRAGDSAGELLIEMDWIDGLPLTSWALGGPDEQARETESVLRVFVSICGAIEHAHARGILHRDLKPSNILVDRDGRPFVLDFGLARPLAEFGAARTHTTLSGELLGTPAYASPEQIVGGNNDLDQRTDIYSLGVLLYEVFVGESPYPSGLSLGRLLSAVEHGEPRRPRAVNKAVPRNLEAVILKAIAKSPENRYQTAAELKADLERCLANTAVVAPSPGFWFDLRALARRHPARATLLVSSVTLLLVLSIVITGYALRLRAAREQTLRAHAAAERVGASLSNLALEIGQGLNSDSAILSRLDEAAKWLNDEFGDDPWARARAHVAFGHMYAKLRAWDKADQHLTTALATYRELGPSDRRNVAETLRLLGLARGSLGEPGALDLEREALAMIRRLESPDQLPLANYYAALGETLLMERGAIGEAEAERCFDHAIELLGGDSPRFRGWTASVLTSKTRGFAHVGKIDAAVAAARAAVALFEANGTSSDNQDYRQCRKLLRDLAAAPENEDRATAKQDASQSIVGTVDHLLIRNAEPEALFRLFSQDFGLPVVWPMQSYGMFKSGGVCAGNVNLEFLALPNAGAGPARLYGIAFAPATSLERSLESLDQADLPHSAPIPFLGTRPDGTSGVMWRSVILPSLQPPGPTVFLYEYGWDTRPKRERLSNQLESAEGGCLGWERVDAVHVGCNDLGQAMRSWTAYFGDPVNPTEREWRFGNGPAVRLLQANEDQFRSLSVRVRSREECQACLEEHEVPYTRRDGVVRATGGVLADLCIEFQESAPRQTEPETTHSDCDPDPATKPGG